MTAVLLWKEYRQQRTVWLAIAFLALVLVVSLTVTLGHGSGLEMFQQDQRLRDSLNIGILCLAVSYGVVSGALLLAGESDDGTLVFLDCLTGRRGPLWARKCLAGVLLTLSLSLALVVLSLGLGFGYWESTVALPLCTLDALAWGLLGGALCRKVLTAVLTGIGFLACSWFTWPVVNDNVSVAFVKAGLAIVGAYVSWRQFSKVDRLRQAVAARGSPKVFPGFPTSMSAVVWLSFRQGRWLLAACVLGTLVFAFTIHKAPLVLWPLGTILLGLLCGLSVFIHDQNEGVQFLGAQRFPPGRIWAVKMLFWGGVLVALTTLAWGLDLAGGAVLYPKATISYEIRGHRWFDDLRKRADLVPWFVFFGLWPLYGFCFGQFFAQILRRPILAVILAAAVTPAVIGLWIPSLLFGGVPLWQLLIVPVVLLSLTRLSQWPWMSGRLFTLRPLVVIGGGVALMNVALAGCFWYRAVEVPELDEPFDVKAFRATLPSPKEDEAGILIRQAAADMREQRSKVEQELGPLKEPIFSKASGTAGVPKPAFPGRWVSSENEYAVVLGEVLEHGWPMQEEELSRWLDRLFEGQWVQDAERATELPLGVVFHPDLANVNGDFGNLTLNCCFMGELFVARAYQLQAHGDSRNALNHLATALALSRHLRNDAPAWPYYDSTKVEEAALSGMGSWVQNVGPDKELLRAAFAILKRHAANIPDPVNSIKAEYLSARKRELDPTFAGELVTLAAQVPWEKERLLRILHAQIRAGTALALQEANLPILEHRGPRLFSDKNSDPHVRRAALAGLPPHEGPGSRLSAAQWGELIEQFDLSRIGNGSVGGTGISWAFSQTSLRVKLLITAVVLYQVEHGQLPNDLDALVPDYLAALPIDPWNGKPFGYRISKGEEIGIDNSEILLAPGQAVIFREDLHRTAFNPGYYPVPIWPK